MMNWKMFLVLVLSLMHCSAAFPLARDLIDMTYVYDNTTLSFPGYKEFTIDELFNQTFEVLESKWLQFEAFSLASHTGTHMDAPSHGIRGGKTVDQLSLESFFAPAAVIDITQRAELDPDAEVTVEDLLQWESGTSQRLDGAIILLKSGWGRKWNSTQDYLGTSDKDSRKLHFPGISPVACRWLVANRSIKGIGTETVSIDKGSTKTYPSHNIILGNGIFILENVANVDKLPSYGANLYVFPMKIGKGSGAPTRIVASIPRILYSHKVGELDRRQEANVND